MVSNTHVHEPKIFILLPVFNEALNLPSLLASIFRVCNTTALDFKVVIIDDGSTDDFENSIVEFLSDSRLLIVKNERNRGLGETVRNGFELITSLADDNDVLIRLDADNTHPPEYFPALLNQIDLGYDVAIASRFKKGGGQEGLTFKRKIISLSANYLFRLLFPIPNVKEYTCGYRAYRISIIKKAIALFGSNFCQMRGIGFCITLEKLIKISLAGASFSEIPFTLKYQKKLGESKMVISITTFGYLIMVLLHHWPSSGWRKSVKHSPKN